MLEKILANVCTKAAGFGGRVMTKTKINSPEILMVVGGVCVIGATVAAAIAARKIDEVVEEHKAEMETIREDLKDDKTALQRETALRYGRTGLNLMHIFLPSVILLTVGISCFLGSHYILRKRNLVLVAAYAQLEDSYNAYRQRVIEEHGEDADYLYANGLREEVITTKEKDENGKTKSKKETVLVPDESAIGSPYAKFFDSASKYWKKNNPNANMLYLKTLQDEWNHIFKSRAARNKGKAFVWLNEVYETLDIPQNQTGAICGWLWDSDGDNFIDFGIFRGDTEATRRFVNGYEDNVLLDFNCQGKIIDKIV